MAQTDEICPELSYDELLELSMKLDDKFRQIKKLNKEHIAEVNRLELEVGTLKYENCDRAKAIKISREVKWTILV